VLCVVFLGTPSLPLTREVGMDLVGAEARPIPPVDVTQVCIHLRYQTMWPGNEASSRRATELRGGKDCNDRLTRQPLSQQLPMLHTSL